MVSFFLFEEKGATVFVESFENILLFYRVDLDSVLSGSIKFVKKCVVMPYKPACRFVVSLVVEFVRRCLLS